MSFKYLATSPFMTHETDLGVDDIFGGAATPPANIPIDNGGNIDLEFDGLGLA